MARITVSPRGIATRPHGKASIAQLPSSVAIVSPGSASRLPYIYMPAPSGDVSGVTDAAAIAAAITALGVLGGHGVVQFGVGTYYTNQPIDVHGNGAGIAFQGCGGLTGGAAGATNLLYVGTGTGSFLNAQSTVGLLLREMLVSASNAGFTGALVDLSNAAALFTVRDCYLGMTSTAAGVIINLDNSTQGEVINNNIVGGLYGVQGVGVAGHISNAHTISENRIGGQGAAGACMIAVDQGWKITGNTFELQSGCAGIAPPAVAMGGNPGAVELTGNWFGDNPGASTQTMITVGTAWDIRGNYIGGNVNTTGVAFVSGSYASVVKGNLFDTHATGINVAGAWDVDYGPNRFLNVPAATRLSPAVSIAAGPAAGTSPTVSVAAGATDFEGQISVVTGSSTTTGVLATITLPSSHTYMRAVISPANSLAAANQAYVGQPASNQFTIVMVTTPSGPGSTLSWDYAVLPGPGN